MAWTNKVIGRKAAVFAALMIGTSAASIASANDVVLKSSDGSINISGELVTFTDEFYVLKTSLGDLRIGAERVRCEGDGCPVFETTLADVTIAGSDTIGLGLMPLLMEGYASHLGALASIVAPRQGEILANYVGDDGFGDELGSYLVSSSSSGDAFASLLDGSSQIGMASRRIRPQEARELKAAGAGNMIRPDQEHIVAVDGLVLIVHPSNPISELSVDQIRGIYTGAITNWSELGGEDMPITFVSRQEESGTRAVFEDRLSNGVPITADSNQKIAEDSNEMASMVTGDPGALGYVGFAFQRGAKPLALINECGIPTTPDAFSAKTEEYALQRRLYLYNRSDANDDNLQSFLDYVTSDDADGVIRKAGFIDLGVNRREQGLDSQRASILATSDLDEYEVRLANQMLSEMVNYDRLSTTFRFRTGSSNLDERGRLDMERLIKYLENQPDGADVMIVGFTDDVGAFDANRQLSNERSAEVLRQLRSLSPETLERLNVTTSGFGEISPVACNISDAGRSINRRVEVWAQK